MTPVTGEQVPELEADHGAAKPLAEEYRPHRIEPEWIAPPELPPRDNKPPAEKGKFQREHKEFNKGKPFRKEFQKYGDKKFKRDFFDKNHQVQSKGGRQPNERDFKSKGNTSEETPLPTKDTESDHDKILKLLKEAKGKEQAPEPVKPNISKDDGGLQGNKWQHKAHKVRKLSRSRSRSQSKNKSKDDITSSSKKRIELLNKRFDMLFQKKKEESEEDDNDDNKLDMSPRSPEESDQDYNS